ncbi:unnamed protein product [Heligmosomoides polygyrus]|uniref:HTH CENPB-type domain-containing protein n=1 Tax=Heligmosomoides polygyrus TaxID=6339 RepID=A0A183GQW5_HELPZ|nr:unnamed protein product [Heligmosomoides polygyrus]
MLQDRQPKGGCSSPSDEKKSLVDAVALLSSDDGLSVHFKTIIGHLLERATLADETSSFKGTVSWRSDWKPRLLKTTVSEMRSIP